MNTMLHINFTTVWVTKKYEIC